MQADEQLYLHEPVSGLPASLLRKEGRETVLIALMRRHTGLNRDRRRDIQKYPGRAGPLAELALSDDVVPARYARSEDQFRSFWSVVAKMRSRRASSYLSPVSCSQRLYGSLSYLGRHRLSFGVQRDDVDGFPVARVA